MLGEAEVSGDRLRLRVLGGFELERIPGQTVSLANRKACGLLAYLALSESGAEYREGLSGLLWSERGEDHARASLRQSLRQLRVAFGEIGFTGFSTDRQDVRLNKQSVQVDLFDVAERLSRGGIAPELVEGQVIPERILYGFESLDPSFTAWLSVIRKNWQDRLVDQLERLLRRESASYLAQFDAARSLIAIDATHEEAHRHIIASQANEGNVASALRQYKLVWDLLDEEYDMEPAEETQSLIAAIKAGTYRAVAPRPDLAEPGPEEPYKPGARLPVIGIAHFKPGGPWTLADYPIEGFRHEIIAALTRFREWIVVDGETFASESESPKGAAAASVDYLLEGSYYEESGASRLIITLKEVSTRQYVWSERLRLTLENWFVLQQEIVRRLAVTLNIYLSAERLTQLVGHSGAASEAHISWLKGYHNMLYWNPENERRAESIFREIIAHTPDFAPAYSSLATVLNSRHFKHPGYRRDAKEALAALELARRAVELDPLDPRAQLALGFSYAMNDRFDQAELYFNLTHQLNPNSPITLVPCAHGLSYCGRHALASQMADSAIELNPMMPQFHWGYILCIRFFAKEFEAALAAAASAQDAITDLHGWKAAVLAQAGHKAEAAETASFFTSLVRKRWEGSAEPTDEEIVGWFMHCFPIKSRADYELLEEGLRLSGLPAGRPG